MSKRYVIQRIWQSFSIIDTLSVNINEFYLTITTSTQHQLKKGRMKGKGINREMNFLIIAYIYMNFKSSWIAKNYILFLNNLRDSQLFLKSYYIPIQPSNSNIKYSLITTHSRNSCNHTILFHIRHIELNINNILEVVF